MKKCSNRTTVSDKDDLAGCGSPMVQPSTHNPKIEALNPAGIVRETMAEKILMVSIVTLLLFKFKN